LLPLGLVTVAVLPQEWDFKLVDATSIKSHRAQVNWADVAIFSAVLSASQDQIPGGETARQGCRGGPTTCPWAAGADYMILDEVPMLNCGGSRQATPVAFFRAEGWKTRRDSNYPRWLLDSIAMDSIAITVALAGASSATCVLYGRRPLDKSPAQLLAELVIFTGWRRGVFMVDDNFIGNKRNVNC